MPVAGTASRRGRAQAFRLTFLCEAGRPIPLPLSVSYEMLCSVRFVRCVGMTDIMIEPVGARSYDVTVEGASRHRVSVPARFGDEDLERVVRVSFEFLLEREPASSILPEFSLDVIARYFPEYEDELPRRMG